MLERRGSEQDCAPSSKTNVRISRTHRENGFIHPFKSLPVAPLFCPPFTLSILYTLSPFLVFSQSMLLSALIGSIMDVNYVRR